MEHKIKGKQSAMEDLLKNTNVPFHIGGHGTPLALEVQGSTNGCVDRFEDPAKHIEMYKAHMILHAIPDGIACRAFPLTLKGSAWKWFANL